MKDDRYLRAVLDHFNTDEGAPIDPEDILAQLLDRRKKSPFCIDDNLTYDIYTYGVMCFYDAITVSEQDEEDIKNMKKVVRYLEEELTDRKNYCKTNGSSEISIAALVIPAEKAYKRAKRIYKHFCMKAR